MGEARRKSLSRAAILARETRCIYCDGAPETLEHMPSRGMLRKGSRPSGMEYGACHRCNERTRGADATAAVIARVHPEHGEGSWQNDEIKRLISALDAHAPGIRQEMSAPDKFRSEWFPRPGSALLQRVVLLRADGPCLKKNLCSYGAKLAMALYREHVGIPLPMDGAVWCQFSLNGGMSQGELNARVQIMPMLATLRQGKKNVADQFVYRYNCDERATLAALAQFHRGLWYTILASSDARIVELFYRPELRTISASVTLRPGEILTYLSTGAPSIAA